MQPQTLTPAGKERLLEQLNAALAFVKAQPTTTPCAGCEHGSRHSGAHCDFFGRDVPAEWQNQSGCRHWLEPLPF